MRRLLLGLLLIVCSQLNLTAQAITSPKEHFGFSIGDNYHLATFTQTEAYLKKLATESNKVKLQTIGKTEEGSDFYPLLFFQ